MTNLPTIWKRVKFILNTTPELFVNWLDRRTLSRALSGNDGGNEPKRDFILGASITYLVLPMGWPRLEIVQIRLQQPAYVWRGLEQVRMKARL